MNINFFSVIIPTYNRALHLPKTLDSVFAQTYQNYEIIVVDNCSTDGTAELLKPFVETKKIRFIQNDRNYERAYSRNVGMAYARGQFVTFLDSDDLMYATNLADAAAYIEKHPYSRFFHNFCELVNTEGRLLYRYRYPSLKDQLQAIVNGNFLSCIGVFLHREISGKHKFDPNPELAGMEDWEFWLRVCAEYPLGRIEKVNNGIVHHPSRSIRELELEKLRRCAELIQSKIVNNNSLYTCYKLYLKRFAASPLVYLATLANSRKQYNTALSLLCEAFQKDKSVLQWETFWRSFRIALFRIDKGI